MKELEYPFNACEIIAQKKKYRRIMKENGIKKIPVRIAILGGSTTTNIKLILELFLLNYGIEPEFYESEYNQYYQDAVFENDKLKSFSPKIIYICTSNKNISAYPDITDTNEEVDLKLKAEFEKYKEMWEKLESAYHCPIIQNNFEMPYYRLLGNRDAYDIHGTVNFLTRLNMRFYEYVQANKNIYLCDINYISADYGLKAWSDPFYWYMYKYAVAVPAIPYLSFNVANIIKSLYGKNKKGFVLDLDNTLWGGVIGDDGADNIILGPEESEGQAYLEFQKYIRSHRQLGVVLTINSKNDYENAVSGINHPYSCFKKKDFISIKANWKPKDYNFSQIVDELNILPESLVFIDDSPAERHIVTGRFSNASAPEITDVTYYIETIDRSGFFEVTDISDDDIKRNEMYRGNSKRSKLEKSFSDYGDFLRSLEMKAKIGEFESVYMARIAQLTNKSNQFNLTTRRYTQTEIQQAANDNNCITLYGKLADKFGDNGIVSVVIGHIAENECHIDLWIMSCRVLKRDMEFAMMDKLVEKCRERSVSKIYGYYYPTAKNHMVENFYGIQGFNKISEDENGNTLWEYDLSVEYKPKNKYIDYEK